MRGFIRIRDGGAISVGKVFHLHLISTCCFLLFEKEDISHFLLSFIPLFAQVFSLCKCHHHYIAISSVPSPSLHLIFFFDGDVPSPKKIRRSYRDVTILAPSIHHLILRSHQKVFIPSIDSSSQQDGIIK